MLTHNENVHVRRWKKAKPGVYKFLLLSDLHWDNPKCDRLKLISHLDKARTESARIGLNGDNLCLMAGKYDPRKTKSGIRPEHNNDKYLDSVIDDFVQFLLPYADLIDFIGDGNHERSVSMKNETDIIDRVVSRLNAIAHTDIGRGGYGGWWVNRFIFDKKTVQTHRIKYYHGSGGGGLSSKGVGKHTQAAVKYAGADLIWMGHVHESYEVEQWQESLNMADIIEHKQILMVRTSTYKEEYKKGKKNWHVERGSYVKPIGGKWLELHATRKGIKQRTYNCL